MDRTCFWTIYDSNFKDMAKGMVKSVKKQYPDIPFIEFEIPRNTSQTNIFQYHDKNFNLKVFLDEILTKGKKLLDIFDRTIYIDADSIMCNKCPDLFGEFDMAVVQNNTPYVESYDGEKKDVYINSGLKVCTSKEAWQELVDEYNKFRYWDVLNLQNALNTLYHNSKFNYKLLEYPDRVYGCSAMRFYHEMQLKNGELFIYLSDTDKMKQVCLLHFAGEWKKDGKLMLESIDNADVIRRLEEITI